MSAREVELKALVERPAELVARIEARGAVRAFRGRMTDRRYDLPSGALTSRDEVLRVRTFTAAGGSAPRSAEVAWKGPTRRESGYKEREELEFAVADSGPVEAILSHLGLAIVDAIERCVEFYDLDDAALRLEWYPRMDVLVEIEGQPAAIESAVAATGMPREAFTADRLIDFGVRYQRRTGSAPALNLGALGGGEPQWPGWAP